MAELKAILGDITKVDVDAIVNAANSSLLGGGGVDGAIHRAAGPELLDACRRIGGCPPGEARVTLAFRLPQRYVIHTVGPVWHGGRRHEAETLASCYRASLELAEENGVRTLAFPSISTGAYRFPVNRAAAIATREIHGYLAAGSAISAVWMVCFDRATLAAYEQAIASLQAA